MHSDSYAASSTDTANAGTSVESAIGHLAVLMDIRRVLLPGEALAGVLVAPEIVPVPGAGDWLAGVVYHGNMAVSVLDLHALIRQERRDGAPRYAALMRSERFLYGVTCTEVYGLKPADGESCTGEPVGGDRRWTDELASTYAMVGDETWCLLDLVRIEVKVQERIRDSIVARDTSAPTRSREPAHRHRDPDRSDDR
ncbi:MAG: chemotaxis protein CheW [Gammaproteobacteria bacterium]